MGYINFNGSIKRDWLYHSVSCQFMVERVNIYNSIFMCEQLFKDKQAKCIIKANQWHVFACKCLIYVHQHDFTFDHSTFGSVSVHSFNHWISYKDTHSQNKIILLYCCTTMTNLMMNMNKYTVVAPVLCCLVLKWTVILSSWNVNLWYPVYVQPCSVCNAYLTSCAVLSVLLVFLLQNQIFAKCKPFCHIKCSGIMWIQCTCLVTLHNHDLCALFCQQLLCNNTLTIHFWT